MQYVLSTYCGVTEHLRVPRYPPWFSFVEDLGVARLCVRSERSMLCRRPSIGFSILMVNVAASILETEYVPSKLNVACDGLSKSFLGGFEINREISRFFEKPTLKTLVNIFLATFHLGFDLFESSFSTYTYIELKSNAARFA